MRTIVFLACIMWSTLGVSQIGISGFAELSYSTIGEEFIDATSEAFEVPELQLNESGIAAGASLKAFYRTFSAGGGVGMAWIGSDDDNVKMNVLHGYGTFGYNLVESEDLILNASLRLGGFNNTLTVAADEMNVYSWGDQSITQETKYNSGSFMYGAEVDVLKLIPQIPGVVVGLTGYFMAPISFLKWNTAAGTEVMGIEQGAYTHYGVSLKAGGLIFID